MLPNQGDEAEQSSKYVRSAFDAAAGLLPRQNSASPASPGQQAAAAAAAAAAATGVPSEVLSTLPPFCFPRGGRILRDKPGDKACHIFSFAIAHSGYYVTCLNYFQPADARAFLLAWESVHPRAAGSKARGAEEAHSGGNTFVYLPAALCLLSRQPYIDVLHEAASQLLPLVSSPQCALSTLLDAIRVLRWVPQPLSGSMRLHFKFLSRTLVCAAAPTGDLPIIDTSLQPFFLYFGAETMLRIVMALMLERRVLVFSSNLAALMPFMQVRRGKKGGRRWGGERGLLLTRHIRTGRKASVLMARTSSLDLH